MSYAIYYLTRWSLRRIFWCMGGLERHGMERVPATGRLIVAANHTSFWDPMVLGPAFDRPLHFMARKTLFDVPGFGWLIRQTLAFPLNREGDSREAIRAFGERLDKEEAVVMFPEGTRSRDGLVAEIKSGVGMLAVRNETPVLPVYIWGAYQSWPRGRKFPRRHRLKVVAGDVIPAIASEGEARKDAQRRIVEEVGRQLRKLELEAWDGEAGRPPALETRQRETKT